VSNPYPVCAWRVGHRDGMRMKQIVVRTSDRRAMWQWLERTRGYRRRQRHTLWVEEEGRPATRLRSLHPRKWQR